MQEMRGSIHLVSGVAERQVNRRNSMFHASLAA